MMAIDSKRLNSFDEVLGERSVDKALRQRAANRRRECSLEIAAGANGPAETRLIRRWYALTVSHRAEIAVDKLLQDARIETWLPMQTTFVSVKHTDRKRQVDRPAFSGYVFARVVPHEESWAVLRSLKWVEGIVSNGARPVAIGDEEINEAKELIDAGALNEKPNGRPLGIGNVVMVRYGLMQHMAGVLEGYVGKRNQRVLVRLLGTSRPISMPLAAIEDSD